MNNDYYVYLHRRATDNKVFYVGKGRGRRSHSKYGRNTYWKNTVNKHGFVVEIVYDHITEEDSFLLEIETIKEMRYHFETTMCNLTDGGEGASNYQMTAGDRKKISDKLKYRQIRENIKSTIRLTSLQNEASKKVISRIVLYLLNKPILKSYEFNRLSLINREDFYSNSLAVKRSVRERLGKQAWNGDTKIYFFRHTSGEEFEGTIRELSVKLGGDLTRTMKNFRKLLYLNSRVSAYGWVLMRKQNE